MEAIGQLADGIAYDFSNLLFVILGQTEFALKQIDPSDRSYSRLREIQLAAEHARWLTAQLLILGRRQTIETQVIDDPEHRRSKWWACVRAKRARSRFNIPNLSAPGR
jgi:signal transduction histidine kinase